MAKSDYLKAYKKGKAARENAKKKDIVTTQARKPKKKKKKESTEPKQQSAPRQSTRTVSSHGGSKGNERRAGAHRAQQTVQKNTQQTTQKQTTRTQGGVYKASKPTSKAPSKRTGAHVTPVNAHRAGAQRARATVTTAVKRAEEKSKKASVTAYKRHEANPRNALGTSVKVRTLKYGDAKKHKQKETEYKKKADDSLRREIAFRLKNEGYEGNYSDAFQREYNKQKNKRGAKVDKEAKKYADDAVGRVGTLKSEDLTQEDYLRMQTAGRMGGGDIGNKALGKKLSEKVGSRTAYSSGKNKVSKAATGVIQGFALADVLEGGVGTYNKDARGVLKDVKESTEYNVGYGVGQMASVVASPTTAAGKALAKGVFKGAAKSTARKLAENAAMDVVAETPMNIADAVKMARDENGKVNRKQLATFLALNTALTGGAGAGMEALGVAATKRSVKKIANLKAKIDNGTATLKDVDDYNASLDKLKTAAEDTQAAKSGFAAQEYDKAYGTTRLSRGEGVELARLNAKKNSASGLTAEQRTRLTELTNKAADIAGENEAIIAKAKESLDTKTAALNTLSKTTGVKYKALNNDELIKTLRENGEDIDDNAFVNGVNFVDKDGNRQILINKDSAQAHYTIVGHETTHLLEGSKEYDTLKSAVREFAESNNEYKELEEQMAKLYKNQTKGMSKEEAEAFLEEELTAEFVGRYLFREEVAEDFIRHLANKDRNLIQKIYDYLATALKNPSSDVEKEQLQTMMKRFDDAFDDMGMNKGAKFQLSENKQTLHAGKNSANDFLTNSSYSPYPQYKKLMKDADNGDEKAAELLAKKTGWYKENGKWQFDIDIKNMSFKNGIKSLAKKGEFGGTLNEEIGGIDHLFQNYPDVGYAGIGFGDTGGAPYTLNIGNKNKSLYGIILNADLVKGKTDNMKINDSLSDALQDILRKIEDGKIARTAEEDYAEELFDVEGYTKLVSQNKKPVLKQNKAAKKAVAKKAPNKKQETTFNANTKNENYEKYKKVFTETFESASNSERVNIMKSFGFRAQDGDVAANLEAASEEFKRVMVENGNPNPIKKTVSKENVDTPMSYNEGVDYIMKDANVSKADANRFKMAVEEYTRTEDSMNIIKDVDDWDETKGVFDDTEHVNELINDINEYVEKSSALELKDGEVICRGIHLPEDEFKGLVDLLKNKMKVGDVFSAEMHPKPGTLGVPSSWSWVRKKAEGFAMWTYDKAYSVLGIQHNNITGTPVEHITSIDGEYEVLFGTKCDRTLMGWELVKDNKLIIHVMERAADSAPPKAKYSLAEMSGGDTSKLWLHNNPNQVDGKPVVENGKVTKEATPTAKETPAKETQSAEPKPAEPTTGEPAKAEPNAGDKATRPMNMQGVIERSRRRAGKEEMNETAIRDLQTMVKNHGSMSDYAKVIVEDGAFGKFKGKTRGAAFAKAKETLERDGYETMLDNYRNADFSRDPFELRAEAATLLGEIGRRLDAGEGDKAQLWADAYGVVEKNSSVSTFGSRALNAQKEFLTATPEGRLRVVHKEIEQLQKRYASRIKGGNLVVDQDKLNRLASATGKEKDDLLDEINRDIWEQIPASLMERLNEYRHCFMLFNAKTHGRNLVGNGIFRIARAISDDMERAILNSNAAKKRIGKLQGGKDPSEVIINKQKVTRQEISDNIGLLENEFHDVYDKSGSRNKFIESGRPDGVPTVKFKAMQKLIDLNYKALEKEDLKGALKPAFNKAYIGYCKARCPEGKDLRKFMEEMTPAQKDKARHYALMEGEYATFRDSCAFSDWLTAKKQTFAGKEANTKWGTMGYRALDMVLEGALPFVKTPVNIFRRSVDFSPASLIMSLGKLAKADSAETFQLGVHQLCTGLTGTGAMGLGVYLASQGMITVKAGEESGDAYYDRDMGYQDYSLKIHLDDKEYSWTLDWMSPMGMSLFSGAAFQKMFDKDGFDNTAALNAFFACTSPITDMSFMSSPKDTVQRFMENASRGTSDGKETDFAGALAQLIVGDMPKNYVSGFFPQLTAQMAGFIDPTQRDVKSTKENVYLKGWQSSARQLASRTMTVRALSKYADEHPELKDNPILKDLILNPKINRRGEDIKTGGNIATRLVNAFLNPANVKEINEDDTDRELINIRNHIEDKSSNDYKFFYYNFTGNPSYDLADGKRMTYQDAYTYGKANRIEQNERIKDMLDAKSYKGMTWKMKADEVDDAHWIGTTVADLKTYDPNYAMKAMLKNNEKEKEAVKEYKRLRGETGKNVNRDYLEYYIEKERLVSRSHASGDDLYRMKGIAAVQKGDDTLLRALDIQKSKVDDIKHYWDIAKDKFGKDAKTKSFKEITDGCCSIMSNCKYADVQNPSKGVKSVSAGMVAKGYTTKDGVEIKGDQIEERVYRLLGHNWNSAQSGGGLMLKYNKDGKYSIEKIVEMKSTLRNQFDENESGSINKQEVIDYIDSLGIDSDDEKACLYEVLYSGGNYKNPYKAQIDDHLKWGENHDDEWGDGKGSGGWGRRGRRRGGWGHGGGGGGGGGTAFTPVVNTAGGAAKQTITKVKVSDVTRPSDYTKPSNLNDAYRKKAKKLRASTTTRRS